MRTGKPLSRAVQRITDLFIPIVDWLFPPQCLICGEASDISPYLCKNCLNACRTCGKVPACAPGSQANAEDIYALFRFDGNMQVLVHHLKYGNMPFIGEFLGERIGEHFAETPLSACDALVPVPLYPARKRERTYNQSFHIAKGISRVWNVPVKKNLLKRRRDTGSQTLLNRRERQENVRDAFVPRKRNGLPSYVCIVDDVFTTGATCMEAARCLKQAGVRKAGIVTLTAAEKDQ